MQSRSVPVLFLAAASAGGSATAQGAPAPWKRVVNPVEIEREGVVAR